MNDRRWFIFISIPCCKNIAIWNWFEHFIFQLDWLYSAMHMNFPTEIHQEKCYGRIFILIYFQHFMRTIIVFKLKKQTFNCMCSNSNWHYTNFLIPVWTFEQSPSTNPIYCDPAMFVSRVSYCNLYIRHVHHIKQIEMYNWTLWTSLWTTDASSRKL